MEDWRSYDNCGFDYCRNLVLSNEEPDTKPCGEWDKIPCPRCGGALSEIRYHHEKKYRHCYSCHMEFYEEGT